MVTAEQLLDARARVMSARALLRALMRQAIAEGWSQARIGAALGMSQPAVSQMLHPERRRRPTRDGRGSSA